MKRYLTARFEIVPDDVDAKFGQINQREAESFVDGFGIDVDDETFEDGLDILPGEYQIVTGYSDGDVEDLEREARVSALKAQIAININTEITISQPNQ